jgi:PPE family/PPE-SVP subfamily C-terminal region
MDFGALPPEINSARMYLGPGTGTLLAASAGWESLGAELLSTAAGYQSAVSTLTDESWTGPTSMAMQAAVSPYVVWLRTTAAQCEEAATRATTAAAAYESAYAMTVPPPLVATNRVQLAALIATNVFGQNTPAIMATEAEYSEMWAQDATAMYNYAASSAAASAVSTFSPPPETTNPNGLAAQAGAAVQALGAKARTSSTQLMSAVTQALQNLATPGSASGSGLSSAAVGNVSGLAASGVSSPASALSSLTGASGKTAKTAGAASVISSLSGILSSLGTNGALNGLFDVGGLAGDVSGLGTDFGGLGLDFGGTGLDIFGAQLDVAGMGSISGAAGSASSLGGLAGIPGLGALGGLGGVDGGAAAGLGQAASLGTLSVPPSWADAVSMTTPIPLMDANAMPGGWGAAPSLASGPTVSKMPLGGMVGRESDGSVQRVGFRSSLIPHSPVAG